MKKTNEELRLAVLIDADNVPYGSVDGMLEEIAKYGTPTFKRIYADWTKPTVSGWKTVLLEHAITPVQQYSYTSGKNATDAAMIIDAMDILYSGKVDGFCIISSDSDFTRLATRLREAGMMVIGMGEQKTPKALLSACDKFIYLEILNKGSETAKQEAKTDGETQTSAVKPIDKKTIKLITSSINDVADESGWAFLADVGNLILKIRPEFDPRNYGCSKLSQLIKTLDNIEVDERPAEKGSSKIVYIRMKRPAKKATKKSGQKANVSKT